MTRDAKRIAAAVAAVQAYLSQEAPAVLTVSVPAPVPSVWAVAGRVEQMASRAVTTFRARR